MSIVLVVLTICFFAITFLSVGAMLLMHRREMNRKDAVKMIDDLDAALDASIAEINKIGALVLKEVDEKYQAVLFLYSLMDDKQKEITNGVWGTPEPELPDGDVVSEMVAHYIEAHSARLQSLKSEAESPESEEPVPEQNKDDEIRLSLSNPKHTKIWEMQESGMKVADIAKELRMGQGEVQLILNLAVRAS